MTFDITGLLIFLLAIVPGFIAQQARSRLVPRSLRTQSVLEETGNYVFNSVVVHLIVFASFRVALAVFRSVTPASLGAAIARNSSRPGLGNTDTLLRSITSRASCSAAYSVCYEVWRNATGESDHGSRTTDFFALYCCAWGSGPFWKKPQCGTKHFGKKPAMSALSLR